jgi:Fe-S cluster assembly protein SufD
MQETTKQDFIESLQQLFKPSDILQTQSWERFLELGLPDRSSESYKYIRLRDLYSKRYVTELTQSDSQANFHSLIYPECTDALIVFCNGIYQPSLSCFKKLPKGVQILPLSQGLKLYRNFLAPRFFQKEKNPFCLLNGAFFQEGVFIYVSPKVQCSVPIQILNIQSPTDKALFSVPRLHLFAGKESGLNLYFHQEAFCEDFWSNQVYDFSLAEGANVSVTLFAQAGENAWNFDTIKATLKEGSNFSSLSFTTGAKTHRQEYVVALQGENSEASLSGVCHLNSRKQCHVNVLMEHEYPSCHSLQKFKGILRDFSRSSFEGKIFVHEKAQKTQAYQRNNHLILSEHAFAYSKPNLEIFADDVKASHGATFGKLNEEELFYLKSRGLSHKQASGLLISGFIKEITDQIPLEALQQKISQLL